MLWATDDGGRHDNHYVSLSFCAVLLGSVLCILFSRTMPIFFYPDRRYDIYFYLHKKQGEGHALKCYRFFCFVLHIKRPAIMTLYTC